MTGPAAPPVTIRQLRDEDVEAADIVAYEALSDVGRQFGFGMGDRSEARIAHARSRIRHLAHTDPEGSVIAERDGEIVGIGLALRRESFWFLSLLAVQGGLQGGGVGRRLLDATLDYAERCAAAMICASPDPKALRRYGRAGFTLHAGFEATGAADRNELPAGLGVREGDWQRDAELVESLIRARRGATYGPDLLWCRDNGMRLLVRDGPGPGDRGAVLTRDGHVATLAAASEDSARRVLWGAIAEAQGDVVVGYLLNNQQWAVEIALAARLSLHLTDTLCTRGSLEPLDWYLPSGLWG